MGVSQFKPTVQPAPQPPSSPPLQSPRWEIGIDRNRVAAFIGVALMAGFGFGYLAARFLASSKTATEKTRVSARNSADPGDARDSRTPDAAAADFHKVSRIIRADTIEAEDLGGIRLVGVSPPGGGLAGTNSAPAQAAMKFTTETLLGKDVRIELEPSMGASGGKDESGNTFAYVYTRDGALFNEEMIKQGDAFAKVDQPTKFLERFRAAEREAMENMRGVWSPADKSAKGGVLASAGDKRGRQVEGKLPDVGTPSIPPPTLDARLQRSLASEPMVFVSAADRMYHKDGCQYLAKKGRPMMLSEAKAAGYVACGRCFASTIMKAP